ncbi:Fur family transcriptional regulator [Hymenobacter psychrotolerans]|uniref:Fur family transcriptional regulator, peroxide stress response regulator n=1 Tax=Hymenobacter psychrotolerans DSM 18569 TaxID=1121959 RepID=A0A1M6SZG3_9BACT|nr:Fur family transcriptional regulator [Hymenobacter psychrotolerans]SHK50056.1 Fur family transcriptional regulator, peroxide stress response regulator [Hymenobacter psychrotolerans DSM 18569]
MSHFHDHSLPEPGHLRTRLAQAGLRATRQRLLILESLLLLPGHPTADDVHRRVASQEPSLSLGTVYKALDSFVAAGLTRRVASAEGSCRRYDADCSAHHHLFCTDTQEIIDFRDPELDTLIQGFFEARGLQNFQAHSFSLHITGSKLAGEKIIK